MSRAESLPEMWHRTSVESASPQRNGVTTMNNSSNSNSENRQRGRFDWIFSDTTISVVLFVTILPALVHGVLSLNSLPVAI